MICDDYPQSLTRWHATHSPAQLPNGLDIARTELGDAAASPEALGFLGLLVKEYGALEESVSLYADALALRPVSSIYALNLIHGYEILAQFGAAYEAALAFLRANPGLSVGGVSCTDFSSVFDGISGLEAVSPCATFGRSRPDGSGAFSI